MGARVWRVHERVEEVLGQALSRLARRCARHPWSSLALNAVLALSFLAGLVNFGVNGDMIQLWSPIKSVTRTAFDLDAAAFGPHARHAFVMFTARDGPGADVLDHLPYVFEVEAQVRALDVRGQAWTDVCHRGVPSLGPASCYTVSPLDYYGLPFGPALQQAVLGDPDPHATVSSDNATTFNGIPIVRTLRLGGVEAQPVSNGSSSVARAGGALLTLFLRDDTGVDAAAWESGLQHFVAGLPAHPDVLVEVTSQDHMETEAAKIGNPNLFLLAMAIVAILLFVSLTLGQEQFHPVNSRVLVGAAGASLIPLAMALALGLYLSVGIELNMISTVASFLLLAIGIDDVFVVAQATELVRLRDEAEGRDRPVEDQVADALRSSGSAVTVTSLTDFIVFATSLSANFQAIREWSVMVMLGVASLWWLVVSSGSAILALDLRRQRADRLALAPWRRRHRGVQPRHEPQRKAAMARGAAGQPRGLPPAPGWSQRFFAGYSRRLMQSRAVRVAVVLAFLAAFGAGLYGLRNVEVEYVLEDHMPDDTPFLSFRDNVNSLFGGFSATIRVGIYGADWPDPVHRAAARDLFSTLGASGAVVAPAKVPFWLHDFEAWASSCAACPATCRDLNTTTPQEFGACARAFLADGPDSAVYTTLLSFADDGSLSASAFEVNCAFFLDLPDGQALLDTFDGIVLDPKWPFEAHSASWWFLLIEVGRETAHALWTSMLYAALAVLGVLLLFLSPPSALIVFMTLGFCLVEVVASMAVWDVKIGVSVLTIFVMSVGFSVDYLVHVAHAFSDATGTPTARAAKGLSTAVKPVLLGATSTVIGTVPLAFTKSESYRAFFKVVLSVVVLGLAHSLVFLPVAFSFLGPGTEGEGEGEGGSKGEATSGGSGGGGGEAQGWSQEHEFQAGGDERGMASRVPATGGLVPFVNPLFEAARDDKSEAAGAEAEARVVAVAAGDDDGYLRMGVQ